MIILPIFGIVFLLIAFIFIFKLKKMTKNGIRTEGIIFDIEVRKHSRNPYPVIRFQTIGNVVITKVPDFYSLPGYPKKGDKVKVIYNPDDPNDFIVESNPGRIIIFILFGLSFIIIWGVLKWKRVEF